MELKDDTIDKDTLSGYLEEKSDFCFELQTLQALCAQNFTCNHGESYIDPWMQKVREFDIRGEKKISDSFCLRLAVECKNIRPNYPLLIMCRPRRTEEAFHEIVNSYSQGGFWMPRPVRVTGEESLYPPGRSVGKALSQVGIKGNGKGGKEIVGSDSDIYNKWAQALSSANDLVGRACEYQGRSAIIPLVVVPGGMLWVAEFNEDGSRRGDPHKAGNCSYFVNNSYALDRKLHDSRGDLLCRISHVEFVTLPSLDAFLAGVFEVLAHSAV